LIQSPIFKEIAVSADSDLIQTKGGVFQQSEQILTCPSRRDFNSHCEETRLLYFFFVLYQVNFPLIERID